MAPTISLRGASACSLVPSLTSNESKHSLNAGKIFPDAGSSAFFGQIRLTQPSWNVLKLRPQTRSKGAVVDGSYLLSTSIQPVAPLCVSFQAGQAEFVESDQVEQKVRYKRRRNRTKSARKSLPSGEGRGRSTAVEDVDIRERASARLQAAQSSSAADTCVAEPSISTAPAREDGKEPDKTAKLPSNLVQLCWQSGDPLGKKVLGKAVVKWVTTGIDPIVRRVAQAEESGNVEEIEETMKQAGLAFVALAQPYLAENPMPLHSEALCLKASTHYPTLFDHFQRGLQEELQKLQATGVLENWQQSHAWKLLKKHAKSDGHKVFTRKISESKQDEVGLTREKVKVIQERINKFVAQAFELLRIERDAELEATQHSLDSTPASSFSPLTPEEQLLAEEDLHPECNDTLRNLIAVSSSTGLGGMHLVTLSVKGGDLLPPTSISPGDMVCVRVSDSKGAGATECMRGSVYSLGEDGTSIAVAVEARYGDPTFSRLFGRPLRIDRISDLADATTYQRDCGALERLQKLGLQKKNPAVSIVETLFGEGLNLDWIAKVATVESPVVSVSDKEFDESQRKAIEVGLDKRRPVGIIQGPPGTGKTKVVVEIIMKAVVEQGEKVLATAPTNAAVDNLVERLALARVNVVRVGNPARVAPAVVAKSLSHIVESKFSKFRRDLGRRRADLRSDLRQCLGDESMEAGLRQMLKQLGKTLKQKERELVEETLKQADVILCTNTGAGDPLVRQVGPFGLVVIDEAGQAIEPSSWIPLLLGKRAVLAGDTCQLAPTILSRQAMEGGLGVSLMERASELHGGTLSTMLTTQYRMNQVISDWASQEMYGGRLKSSPTVSSRLLCDSPKVMPTWITQVPLLLLDTRLAHGSLIAGCEECMDPAGTGSFYNEGEADIVMEHIRALLSGGVLPENISVQSPYMAQVQLLRDRAEEIPGAHGVQVASVDSFQGREADAVIISMVRSNRLGVVGFLGDNRRMNVAITRARKHVAIVCDSTTVSRNPFLKKLLQYIRQHGEVRCAFQGWSISGLLKSHFPRP